MCDAMIMINQEICNSNTFIFIQYFKNLIRYFTIVNMFSFGKYKHCDQVMRILVRYITSYTLPSPQEAILKSIFDKIQEICKRWNLWKLRQILHYQIWEINSSLNFLSWFQISKMLEDTNVSYIIHY